MKYSLRSLMTFSIRDLFLVTMIVALAVGWWLDRSRLATEAARERENSEDLREMLDAYAPSWGVGMPKEVLDRLAPDYEAPPMKPIKVVYPDGGSQYLPNSPAPAPNSPKP